MDISFINVFITVFALLILAIPGYILVKTKVIKEDADKVLSMFVLYGCQPAMLIMGFQKTEFNIDILKNMAIVALLTVLVHVIMSILVSLIFRNKEKGVRINCMRFASVFGNCGYMGLPFIQGLFRGTAYEGEVLIYASMVIVGQNLVNWSLGRYIISGDKKYMSFKKAFLNPSIISLFIGLLLFLILKVPVKDIANSYPVLDLFLEKFMDSVDLLSTVITPLAMSVIGIKIAKISVKELFLDLDAYITSFVKLVITPIITTLIILFLPINETIKFTLFFILAMPSATNTVMFAVEFNGDSAFASKSVLLSTILSIISIPLMYLLFSSLIKII